MMGFKSFTLRAWKAFSVLVLASSVLLVAAADNLPAQELHTAQQVRSLTAEQAAQSLPVRLRGVVTFFDEDLFSRFVQDETAGIYLQRDHQHPGSDPGPVVEIEGSDQPRRICAHHRAAESQDHRRSQPAARQAGHSEQLASGKEDSQFVEVVGIVRSVYLEETSHSYCSISLRAAAGSPPIRGNCPSPARLELVDSTVRVRGVCSTLFNRQRQLFGIRLMVPRSDRSGDRNPCAGDPFAIPPLTIGSLLQFTAQGTFGHRVKVAGTVVYQEPGVALFIQDEKEGLSARPGSARPCAGRPGRSAGLSRERRVHAGARRTRFTAKSAPAPGAQTRVVTLDEALPGTHDCRLVRITAKSAGTHPTRARTIHGAGKGQLHLSAPSWSRKEEGETPSRDVATKSSVSSRASV